ncbi:MAG: FAD-dependent oxidoreductase [Candidatus Wallbacteria bacterium]|nr:FAD-dependent oxidoreductase [Candidatus Wallbacteria bacterium]
MKILIIGGGFAGLAAARELSTISRHHSVTLLDRNDFTTMLPALPDLAGGKISASALKYPIRKLVPDSVEFKRAEISLIDPVKKEVLTQTGTLCYDYLITAYGSRTDFYGFDQNPDALYTLDSLNSAIRMQRDFRHYLKTSAQPGLVICGAGYTGLETAFSLRYLAEMSGCSGMSITMIEAGERILPFLSPWLHGYVTDLLRRRGITVMAGNSVSEFDGRCVTLKTGERIENAFVCWCAGTRRAIEISGSPESLKDGRLRTDAYLRVQGYPEVFAAGDAAAIEHNSSFLRKSVNFAIYSGKAVGRNLAATVTGGRMKPFVPIDAGWVIPLHETAVGRLFDRYEIRGRLGLRLHYAMCGLRSRSLRNGLKFIKTAVKLFERGGTWHLISKQGF